MEYCITDTFSPQCTRGEVIMVTSAKYGRMKVGKCVPVSFGRFEQLYSEQFNYTTDNISNFHVNFQQHPVAFIRLLPQYYSRWIRRKYDEL